MEQIKSTITLPEGWIWTTLDSITANITDGSHNPPSKQNQGIPMLSARNIENGKISFDEVRFISENEYEYENQRTRIEAGDVLLTIVATIGRSAIVPNPVKQEFALQRSVAAIKPLINGHFLMYVFQGPVFQKLLTFNAKGTAQKGVYLKTLRELSIPLPPIEEQHRIVSRIEELFSELDHAEEALKKAQKQLEVYKQALLKSAFEGKESRKLTKIGDVVNKISLKANPKKNTSFNFVGLESIKPQSLLLDSTFNSNSIKSSSNVFRKGNILYSRMRPNLNKVWRAEFDGICSSEFFVLDGKGNLNNDFLKYLLHSYDFVKFAVSKAIGDRPRLGYKEFAAYEFYLPNINEQFEIIQKLELSFTLIENLERSIDSGLYKLKLAHQTILKKAFQGHLVSQDNENESAYALLERIQKEKVLYISSQKSKLKEKPKSVKQMRTKKKEIKEILEKSSDPIPSEQLWQDSIHFENIEAFYAELKKIEHEIEVITNGKKSSIHLKR